MRITKDLTSNIIGEGGFGIVYRGELKGTQIAVKVRSHVSKQGQTEFDNEVDIAQPLRIINFIGLALFFS